METRKRIFLLGGALVVILVVLATIVLFQTNKPQETAPEAEEVMRALETAWLERKEILGEFNEAVEAYNEVVKSMVQELVQDGPCPYIGSNGERIFHRTNPDGTFEYSFVKEGEVPTVSCPSE